MGRDWVAPVAPTAPVAFVPPTTYLTPKTPTYGQGYLIIDSDDGTLGAYTHWYPLFRRKSMEHSQWYPWNVAVFCPAVSTARFGDGGMMTEEQVLELHDAGFEVTSHGRSHLGVGRHYLTSAATAGATVLNIQNPGRMGLNIPIEGDNYWVKEGAQQESVKVIARDSAANANGTCTLATPLQGSYSTSAYLVYKDEFLSWILVGVKDDLEAIGITPRHHIYTWYDASPEAEAVVRQHYDSARYRFGLDLPDNAPALYALRSQWNQAQGLDLEADLDAVALKNGVMSVHGHGETGQQWLDQLEWLIDAALARGIRICTRTEAMERLRQIATA